MELLVQRRLAWLQVDRSDSVASRLLDSPPNWTFPRQSNPLYESPLPSSRSGANLNAACAIRFGPGNRVVRFFFVHRISFLNEHPQIAVVLPPQIRTGERSCLGSISTHGIEHTQIFHDPLRGYFSSVSAHACSIAPERLGMLWLQHGASPRTGLQHFQANMQHQIGYEEM